MAVDDYNPERSLAAYFPSRNEHRVARLWSREKMLHDLADLGAVDFFEGDGSDPTVLPGYAADKLWLRVDPGVTDAPGTVRYYGGGDATLLASWPELDRAGFASHALPTGSDTGVADHVAAADPHPQYLTTPEGDARYVQPAALGTAAALNHGTAAGNLVRLDAAGGLPAVDGSALLNLPSGGGSSDWLAHASGDASAWLPSHAAGPSGAATMSNGAIVANRLYLTPLVLPRGMTVTQLTVRVNAAGAAGTKARLGIYNAAANGSPGTLLVDAGEIATDVGSSYVSASVSVTLDPLKRYFMALVGNGTPAMTGAFSSAFGNAPLGFSLSGASPLAVGGVVASFTYAALPADCSGLSIGTGVAAHIPYVFVS